MELSEQNRINVRKIANKNLGYTNAYTDFFSNKFPLFNIDDEIEIISIFQQKKARFYHYLFNNSDVRKIIFKNLATKSSLSSSNNSLPYNVLEMMLYLNNIKSEYNDYILNDIRNRVKSGELNIMDSNVINCLDFYIRNCSYKINKDSKLLDILEELLIIFIDNITFDESIINNPLLMILLEVCNTTPFGNIWNYMESKKVSNNLDYYKKYIEKDIPVEESMYNDFYLEILRYKFSKLTLPDEWCKYIYKHYSNDDKLKRFASTDAIRNYLQDNGINNIAIFHDNMLHFPGMAGTYYMALNHYDLSRDMFHEATHIIQKRDVLDGKNLIRYRYNMLKDFLIQTNISWKDYNGHNHDLFLFEIDADVQGSIRCGEFYLPIVSDKEAILSEMEKVQNEEDIRIQSSSSIVLNGENVDKLKLFDEIMLRRKDYLDDFPVLRIEYNPDGSRKNDALIQQTIDEYRQEGRYSEEELDAIESCIFGTLDKGVKFKH